MGVNHGSPEEQQHYVMQKYFLIVVKGKKNVTWHRLKLCD